jgi:hypothetical protein
MEFIQVIEMRTADIDKIRAIDEEWEKATEGKRTARRSIVTQDRNDPDHYFALVFFDSYESAMENSQLPETQALSSEWTAAMTGPPTFHDLDVLADRS